MSDIKEATRHTVPEYFQDESEESLREQVAWQQRHLGLDDAFFAQMLRVEEQAFSAWRQESAALDEQSLATLCEWWQTVLFLFGMRNGDTQRMRQQIELTVEPGVEEPVTKYTPSWPGSIKEYLKSDGRSAIRPIYRWLSLFHYID